MGSQTLEILRQGVWASLTGGWFYDPHQGVFCNIVHLYLWLFLLCFPFVTFLYFPATLLTWSIYCVLTSLTILGVKVINMALHRLYDRAQTMSESNLKNPFFKITKESEGRDDEVGIEMQVMSNDMLSRNSVEKAINEASEENSIMSMENVNSIIDLKVDVHRKNSSESIELMFSCSMSSVSQQDQQSITGSTSVNKSLRSGGAVTAAVSGSNTHAASDVNTKYLTVYPEHESEIPNTTLATATSTLSSRQPHLLRKSSEDFKRRHQRRRLERQNSLDAAAESTLVAKSARNQSDTLSTVFAGFCNETFLHHQQPQQQQQQQDHSFCKSISTSKVNTAGSGGGGNSQAATTLSIAATSTTSTTANSNTNHQRLPATNVTITTTTTIATTGASTTNSLSTSSFQPTNPSKTSRLQRHRSSETHDERLRQQTRGLFLPIHHEHHHASSGASSSGTLAAIGGGILDADELELGLSGSVGVRPNRNEGRRGHGLQSWVLGSSSDVYIEDDSFTKSDLGIEQIEKRNTPSAGSKSRSAFVLQQQQHPTSHYPHQQQFRLHRQGATIRKDSNSTMSALQLPVAAPPPNTKQSTNMKRRRHSNATSQYKSSGAAAPATLNTGQQQPTVRRIKSAALEISCPHPSVSNLTPHPNSVEAINGQQQIKNPQSALLPPPSKCLVRNPHLNLCPKFGGSFGSSTCSASSLNFGGSGSGSTMALIESVYPIVEQADERASLDLECGSVTSRTKRLENSTGDLEITDIDNDDDDENDDEDDGDNDEHDAVDDIDDNVDNETRRHLSKKHSCQEDHGTCEPDVCQILADDEFKDFDDNFEQILTEIQSEELELQGAAALSCTHDKIICEHIDSDESDAAMEQHCDEAASTTKVLRERLHSTDSETDNNGSRSPLLSGGSGSKGRSSALADKALMLEIAAVQQQKPIAHHHIYDVRLHQAKGEGDSGCPSSDCEQVSASSKDMLLSGMDLKNLSTSPTVTLKAHMHNSDEIHVVDVEKITDDASSLVKASNTTASVAGKSLGAIPKVVKYREVDKDPSSAIQVFGGTSTGTTPQQHLHKRRGPGGGNGTSAAATNSTSKAASRTSSSTSSRSFSADSFSADIHKMLWLMSGGTVDENGHPIPGATEDMMKMKAAAAAAAAASASAATSAQGHVVPASMSVAHFQFYQDALNAFHAYPTTTNSVEGLSIADRMYLREKLHRSSKQMSEAGNASLSDFSHAHDLPTALLTSGSGVSQGRSPLSSQAIGGGTVLSSASHSGGIGTRTASTTAPLTIQGLINVINERTNSSSAARMAAAGGGGISTATPAAILNVDGHQIEHYCDYWRPACMLSAEKPSAPKTFYRYRFKFCGYEREYKISMDRLELLALFDRDLHWLHIVLSVMLAAMVSYLGATILQLGFYNDLFAFLFCAVIAGSQYSLVKSVQPDAASPIHGFNKTVAYSRAIYFSFCGCLLLLLQQLKLDYEREPISRLLFFGINYAPLELATLLLYIMSVLLLCFPLIFSLGLFPQINTFLMYLLEQIDMHVFGGNAAGSLLGSFLCVLRSIFGIMLLYGPLYAALAEGRGTQYIVFSIFCAMLIPLGYHLSRSASDFSHLWSLIKTSIVSTYRDDDDELSAASSSSASDQKLTTSTPKRNKTDTAVTNAVSGEQIEMSSMEKLHTSDYKDTTNQPNKSAAKSKSASLASSSQTLVKPINSSRKAMNSCDSVGEEENCAVGGIAVAAADTNNENTEENINDDDTKAGTSAGVSQSRATTDKYNIQQTDDDRVSTSSTTNPGDISTLTAGGAVTGNVLDNNSSESPDPLPKKLQNTVNTRLKNDLVVTTLLAVVVLGLHCSTVFSVLQPDLNIVLYGFTGALGLFLHYVIPQMRKHMPWLCFARPLLRQKEFGQFEVADAAKVMWFEKVYIYLCMLERNVLFPLLVISALTADAQIIANKFGVAWGTVIVATCALKFIRNAYSDPTNQYLIVMFTVLFFRVDFKIASETFLIDYFFVSIAFRKCCDFLLKLQFIVTYIAPWQITWGSAFHAFAQPFSVPHSAMLFLQAGVSALLSTPLNPFLGSAIFLTSYVRPIKFWERDYNTRRIDHSNTRLSSQLERDLGADDNNLNSIFYEHLTRSLQHSLCGDLLMGRWGNVHQGDCFVLASDYLNCLVHIIELGNGLCTFQMRGLEFRGTYCQQREVEAITEDVEDNDGCCCCDPGHLPRMLSANAMFSTRWLAWQVVAAQYVLEGYSISDNLASATLQVFEYRKVLITYYIKSIIYYVVKNPKLEKWLSSGPIQDALQHTLSRQFVDLDPIFNYNLDEDFDFRALGITRTSFCFVYLSWIQYCCDKRKEQQSQPSFVPNCSGGGTQSATNESTKTTTQQQQTNLTTSQGQSQSQTQLRARPHKSATMSGTGTGTGGTGTVNISAGMHSSEQIATSHSFANISRQTSESAPGLTGAGITNTSNFGNVSISTHIPMHGHNSFENSSTTVGYSRTTGARAPQKPPKTSERYYNKHDSPTTENSAATAASAANLQRGASKQRTTPTIAKDSAIVSLCLALGLLARRSLATASHSSLTSVEFFLHGLHALFKGDFRITSPRDEWVFADMELLHAVVAPAVKMALKLQQDHISNPDEFLDPDALYTAIASYSKDLVISHEADPVWRSAVLRGAPNLLALRHVMEDGSDEYRIIRLTKRFLSFRVIKLNRECVRGLWAGQQQELIYLRNRNPERGSIQNAKQALRNIINSSCDQPIGYPIYVSPLTTSYADTNEQLCQVIGGAITLETIKSNVIDWWHRVRERCRQGCSSGSALESANLGGVLIGGGSGCGNVGVGIGDSGEIAPVYISAPLYHTLTVGNFFGLRSGNVAGISGSLSGQYGSQSLAGVGNTRSSLALMNKPTSTTLLAGLLNRERDQEREREASVRDSRILRKGLGQSNSASTGRSDRERRATLPTTSSILGAANGNSNVESSGEPLQLLVSDSNNCSSEMQKESSPRYAKISCSSGNLGIGNIITTPGDYPRKSKTPICLTAAAANACDAARNGNDNLEGGRRAPIELFKKVIIVDGTEIYDCLDLGRRIDVVWPSEKMRANGGRLSWKNWTPCVGMVGYVVHYWLPNHADQRFRSHVNRALYLIEIGDHYVPVGEFGVREYHQIMDSRENLASGGGSNRSSVQREFDEYERLRDGLTPILGSSVESPTTMTEMPISSLSETYTQSARGSNTVAKISAVSSSSSDDEELSNLERRMEMHRRDIINMMKLMSEKKKDTKSETQEDNMTKEIVERIDIEDDENLSICLPKSQTDAQLLTKLTQETPKQVGSNIADEEEQYSACSGVEELIRDSPQIERQPPIKLFQKVIIVDGTEIYDCLDQGFNTDIVWPNEMMRGNGGRFSWKEWSPCVGMSGHVVHYWLPNHVDQRFRSHVNHTLYLIEIGDYYVPVGEYGIREYHQIRENFTMNATDDAFNIFVKKCKLHRRNAMKKTHESTIKSPPIEKVQRTLPSSTEGVTTTSQHAIESAAEDAIKSAAEEIDVDNTKDVAVEENTASKARENEEEEDALVGSLIDKQKDTEAHDDQQQNANSSDV